VESRDPGAPPRPLQKEIVLLCGFLLCVVIAVVALVLPELYGAEPAGEAPKKSPPAPADR
jgi:hypothetical protein